MSLFMCLNQAGLPFLMSYDQRTGRLEPVFATFLPASGFEPVPYCQPKALSDNHTLDNSQAFISSDNAQYHIPHQNQKGEVHQSQPSDDQQSSEYGERSPIIRTLPRKKNSSQNQNRNIIPNIIQQIFSYLSKAKKSRPLCERIFRQVSPPEGVSCTVSRFYIFHKLIKENMNHYVNQHTLTLFREPNRKFEDIFGLAEQSYFLKVTRIMIGHFLNNISPLLTIKSKRMGKEKRIEHLRVRRYLFEKLKNKHFD